MDDYYIVHTFESTVLKYSYNIQHQKTRVQGKQPAANPLMSCLLVFVNNHDHAFAILKVLRNLEGEQMNVTSFIGFEVYSTIVLKL